jgi:curved DNA-binding protein CbpA
MSSKLPRARTLPSTVSNSRDYGPTFPTNCCRLGFLGIKQNAGQEDINKGYRQKSRLLHPDKAKQKFLAAYKKDQAKQHPDWKPEQLERKKPSQAEVKKAIKEASARFARLGLIAKILRGSGRERYDHFLANGFPAWRGSGYYYARFRPGLGTVLLGLFIFVGGGAHYGALYMSWKRQQEFIGRYVRHARRAAWGDDLGIKGIPNFGETAATSSAPTEKDDMSMASMNRKQRRMQDKENKKSKGVKEAPATPAEAPSPAATGPTGGKKRVMAENGKVLIVDSIGNVFMEQKNEDGETEEYLLDVRPRLRSHLS